MLPECGTFAIVLALCFAFLQCFSFKMTYAIAAAYNQLFFLLLALGVLILSFVINDFSVLYVNAHSHVLLPLIYRLGAVWSGHEGSLLLWCVILSAWCAFFIIGSDRFTLQLRFHMIRVLGLISLGFISFLFFTSNPFKRYFPTEVIEGNDLTPVLQDPGLFIHPPMLYLGYVGFVIIFAFAIAVLLQGKLDKSDLSNMRSWLLLPWSLLSGGIVLGSWWAYRELGWGGWWFWDPVENASLLPWLSATAFLHGMKLSEKTGKHLGWILFLAIFTFSLCLFGTFLVRSGTLTSVHAFANDSTKAMFLMSYVSALVGSAFLLYALRIKKFFLAGTYPALSKETFLLTNTIILFICILAILLGVLYPILLQILNLNKIVINESYFNLVFAACMLPLLFLMGWGPHVNWHQQNFKNLLFRLYPAVILAILLSVFLPKLFSLPFYPLTTIGLALGFWVFLSTIQYFYELIKKRQWRLSHCAMLLAHLGISILVIGISVNKSYSEERQVTIALGEHAALAGYDFYFKNLTESKAQNYQTIVANFSVQKNNQSIAVLAPEIRLYPHDQLFNKTGIVYNAWRDLSVALGPLIDDKHWSIRLYYKPLVRWIWFGGLLMVLGGMLTLLDRRRKAQHALH